MHELCVDNKQSFFLAPADITGWSRNDAQTGSKP
jgi:hypothetical protein